MAPLVVSFQFCELRCFIARTGGWGEMWEMWFLSGGSFAHSPHWSGIFAERTLMCACYVKTRPIYIVWFDLVEVVSVFLRDVVVMVAKQQLWFTAQMQGNEPEPTVECWICIICRSFWADRHIFLQKALWLKFYQALLLSVDDFCFQLPED